MPIYNSFAWDGGGTPLEPIYLGPDKYLVLIEDYPSSSHLVFHSPDECIVGLYNPDLKPGHYIHVRNEGGGGLRIQPREDNRLLVNGTPTHCIYNSQGNIWTESTVPYWENPLSYGTIMFERKIIDQGMAVYIYYLMGGFVLQDEPL